MAFATGCLNQYKFYYSHHYATLLLLFHYRKQIRHWTGRIRVCSVVIPVRYEVGWFFFPVYLSTSFKNQNIHLKKNRAVEAAKSNRLSLHRVKIHLGRIRSKRCRSLFLENEAQINKNNYTMMLFMSKQVSLPKISSILQKIKISLKCHIRPFCTKAFNYKKVVLPSWKDKRP